MYAAGTKGSKGARALSSHKDIPCREGIALRCICLFHSPEALAHLLEVAER